MEILKENTKEIRFKMSNCRINFKSRKIKINPEFKSMDLIQILRLNWRIKFKSWDLNKGLVFNPRVKFKSTGLILTEKL